LLLRPALPRKDYTAEPNSIPVLLVRHGVPDGDDVLAFNGGQPPGKDTLVML